MESFIFSVNVTLPVVIVILFGYVLYRVKVLPDSFMDAASRLVFDFAYPCSLFMSISASNIKEVWSGNLIAFFLLSLAVSYIVFIAIIPRFLKDGKKCASVVQGILRVNFLLQGTPMAVNMYGTAGAAPAYLMLPFSMVMNTVISFVVFFVIPPEKDADSGKLKRLTNAVIGIFKNPLVLACLFGMAAAYFEFSLPEALGNAVGSVGRLASPLALILLGAQFRFDRIRDNIGYTLPATVCRLVVMPAAITAAAMALGFRGSDLGCLFVLNASSTASISFVMAKRMGGDEDVAAQIVGLTSALSGFTVFIGVFVLRSYNLI